MGNTLLTLLGRDVCVDGNALLKQILQKYAAKGYECGFPLGHSTESLYNQIYCATQTVFLPYWGKCQ
jgi:hypothetical protein